VANADESLFDAIDKVVRNQYVLVQDATRKITGIVTTSDLSLRFRQLAEPFLLLSEIENQIRQIIVSRGRFTLAQLKTYRDLNDARNIDGVAELSLGEYQRLLQNPQCWEQLQLGVDRTIFDAGLDRVREIRNDVMHFDPDPITDSELNALRRFTVFLQRLQVTLPVRDLP
jgi:hypothetical protein